VGQLDEQSHHWAAVAAAAAIGVVVPDVDGSQPTGLAAAGVVLRLGAVTSARGFGWCYQG